MDNEVQKFPLADHDAGKATATRSVPKALASSICQRARGQITGTLVDVPQNAIAASGIPIPDGACD
jgi:hypothetical protein